MPSLDRPIGLYDGQCPFCTQEAKRLERLAGGRIQAVDLHTPGLLQELAIPFENAMTVLHLRFPDGRVFVGAEAVARALGLLPVVGLTTWLYYVPGLRQLLDWSYRRIATARYRLFGKQKSAACESGTCELHFRKR
jgi:predicted DCC family thiol-disulfide oxidoreductase YuxK